MKKYQVLARKYRPQQFKDVVGQEVIVTTLKNALRFDRLAHAYLFCGSRGTGKTTLARLFAKALNCKNLTEEFEPCNTCSSCLEITAGQSLDVIEIDGASNRGIDDIRNINEMVGYIPSDGKFKIYIIDEVHMLTKEAFNALLKTLEEPPQQAKFFFATTEPHKILPTIISRCQRFDLKRILSSQIILKLDQIAKDLEREVEEEALYLIAELSDGSLRDAESLFDQLLCFVDTIVKKDTVQQVFGLIPGQYFFALDLAFAEYRLSYAFELVEELYKMGKDLSHFMSQLIEHYRIIVNHKINPDLSSATSNYAQSSKKYTLQQSLYLLEYLITKEPLLQKSVSPRIFLETVLLHIIRSKNKVPVESLVRKLLEMESSLSLQAKQFPQEKQAIAKPPSVEKKPQEDISQSEKIPSIKEQDTPPLATSLNTPNAMQKDVEVLSQELPKEQSNAISQGQNHYDTLMRFAAVELEGSLNLSK